MSGGSSSVNLEVPRLPLQCSVQDLHLNTTTSPVETVCQHPRRRYDLRLRSKRVILLTCLFTMANTVRSVLSSHRFTSAAFLSGSIVDREVFRVVSCMRHKNLPGTCNRMSRLHFSSKSHLGKEEPPTEHSSYRVSLEIPTPQDMEDVAAILSMGTAGGDVILLGGGLGAGKTCFSRGFIRARTGLMDMRVTSPTYLLSNTYEADGGETIIHHMDLYRLSGNDDLAPLNMEHVFTNCISLIEWPSRLGPATPSNRLEVNFRIDVDAEMDEDESRTRHLTLQAYGSRWRDRLNLLLDEGYIDDLLSEDINDN